MREAHGQDFMILRLFLTDIDLSEEFSLWFEAIT